MLEDTGLDYKLVAINIGNGEQFDPEFLKIAPNNRMPALVDHAPADGGGPLSIFESGAMLIYLAEKTGQFLPADLRGRHEVLQWLIWQMAGLGPMLGQNHHFNVYAPEKLPYAIKRYVDEGSRLLCGGGRHPDFEKGYFTEPTAFVAEPDHIVAQQEFFGPVQVLIGYEDEADAIRIANNSNYGLSGGILSADHERAKNIARQIRTGTMMINGGMWYGPEVPFGGYKCSGLGRAQ